MLPNENYPIILQSDNAVDSIKFQLAIGSNTANSTLKNVLNSLTKEVTLAPNTRQLVNLAIPDLPVESYMFKLNVTIGNQKPIEKSSHLKFPKPSSMILIQTDKGLYKPGDKVLFRVVFLNKEKRPESGKNVGIHLIDPKSNRIKQWNQTLDQFGHFESEYTFSQNSELGQYQLHVQSGNNKRVLVIELAEYVLPLVEVKVQTPPYITYDSTQVPVTVEAHYTHGNAVQGTVNITLINKDYYETDEAKLWSEIMPLKEISVLKPINGKTETTFDPVKQLRLETVSYSTRLEVRAVVVETVSGRNYTASSEIQLSKEDVKFQLVSTTPNLKSGLDYYGRIKVTTQDDKPIDDPNNLVQIRYSFDSESKMQQLNATLSHGLIPLIIKVPLKAKYMYIGAMYKGQRYRLSTVSKTSGSNDTDIQFVPHNRTMEVDQIIEVKKDKVKIRVKTNVPISNYNYVISAEKRIVHHQQVKQASNNEFILDVPMLHSMNNGFKLIMYTLPTNNDSKKWSVEATTYEPITTDLTNLTLSSNVETARPGDMANIRVVGPPSAFVAVLGIDQSAMLLKEPNLINEAQFKREFGQLDQYEGAGSYYYEYKSYEEFESAFLTFTTNKFPPRPRMVYYSTRRLSGPAPEFQADTESMMISSPVYAKASAFGGSFRESAPTTRLRKDFPETWLWSSQVTDAVTGQTFFERPVPDTITSWVVNAFGVHPQSGLAVARAPLKLTVFNPFFIKPNLPYSIVREEVAAIPVIIYNYLGAHKKVDVTLYNELNEFVFTKTPSELFSSENELESEQEQSRLTKTVEVASGSVGKVIFMIRAQQVGHIKLQMLAQATDGSAGDKTEHLLLVKPEGQTQHFNKAFLVRNKRDSQNSSLRVDIAIPDDAVPGSRLITVNAIGDMLGVSFSNIEKLVRMPTGCGEQNMAGLVPNIVALEYLEATSQASPQLKQRILNHLEQGYARQLKYQHLDGGFSAFGSNNNNQSASTWLTAYVVAWFVPAMRSIDIDKNVVQKSVDFLVGRKVENGKSGVFQELGRLYDRHMSGGVAEHLESSNSTALDAFVLSEYLQRDSIFFSN